ARLLSHWSVREGHKRDLAIWETRSAIPLLRTPRRFCHHAEQWTDGWRNRNNPGRYGLRSNELDHGRRESLCGPNYLVPTASPTTLPADLGLPYHFLPRAGRDTRTGRHRRCEHGRSESHGERWLQLHRSRHRKR